MRKMITENGVKPIVLCKLVEFKEYGSAGKPHIYVAHVVTTSEHPVAGPSGKRLRTSQVLNIDFQKKQFETLNTVYRWGES